jgi:hypothetical protein
LRDTVGNYVNQNVVLPKMAGVFSGGKTKTTYTGPFYLHSTESGAYPSGTNTAGNVVGFDTSRLNSVYSGDGTNTLVQPRATQMYLYFYVGAFTQTALENTAGINAELFNVKLDQDFSNATADIASSLNSVGARTVVETYRNNTNWYRKYSDGWVEQGCDAHNRGSSDTWNFLIAMPGTYNVQITARGSQRYAWVTDMQSGYLKFSAADDSSQNNDGLYYIKVCGYAAS